MPLINWKVEWKRKWTRHCVLAAAGNDNTNDNSNNIIFDIKDIKLYVETLSAKDNQKLWKRLNKGFKRSVYWNKYKTKTEKKIRQTNIDIFPDQVLLELVDYLFSFIQI